MNRNPACLILLFLWVCLTSCVDQPAYHWGINKARANLERLEMGMTKKEVIGIMGKPYAVEASRDQDGAVVEYLIYWTQWTCSGPIPDSDKTPICLVDGKCAGWGQEYFYKRGVQLPDDGQNQDANKKSKSYSIGTGFVISGTGVILTAWHVVAGADNITIVYQGKAYSAEFVSGDKGTDVAVLKARREFPVWLTIGPTESVEVSDKVFTVGFPNVRLQGNEPKYTEGVISAKSGIGGLVRYFQVSVPIQPGNSGGPLVNRNGEVVGMVTAKLNEIYALDKTGSLPQNVNYALKSSFILPCLETVASELKQSDNMKPPKDAVKHTLDSVVLITTSPK